jgi:hypothetical protein
MTKVTTRLCTEPLCDAVLVDALPGARCEKHRRQARPGSPGYGHRWRKMRDAYIREHPRCEATLPNGTRCRELAVDVHHTNNATPADPAAFYNWDALSSRCRSCHRRDTEHHKRDVKRRSAASETTPRSTPLNYRR